MTQAVWPIRSLFRHSVLIQMQLDFVLIVFFFCCFFFFFFDFFDLFFLFVCLFVCFFFHLQVF